MSVSRSPWSLENVRKLRAELAVSPPPPVAPERDERYHAHASLVTSFEVQPAVQIVQDALENLINDSLLVSEEKGRRRWMMKNDVRKRVLQRLQTAEAISDALHGTLERPRDVLQLTLESHVRKEPKPLDQQTPEELSATLQVIDWLQGTNLASGLPAASDVRLRVEAAALLQPFRTLVSNYFRGRKRELAALRDYVDAGKVSSLTEKPPLLIYGPGGMGKSSLVAKFILDALAMGSATLPVIYLDCDRPGLAAEEPVTFLAEAVRQLGLQFPQFYDSANRLRDAWLHEIVTTRAEVSEALASDGLEGTATRGRGDHLEQFRLFVRDLDLSDRPVLLVIDTFEELQYRSRHYVGELFQFLNELQSRLPYLRTVLAGRNPIPDFDYEPLPLENLDREAAQGYLEARGVESPDVRMRLANALHGNPLSLKLAAEIIKRDSLSTADLSELESITDDTQIQGVLYRRILDHVHTEPVRQIAHPGLILRRITKGLIWKVLAGPCGLVLESEDHAGEVFDLLREELSLVVSDGDGVRHRSDVRRVMLGPLRKDQREKTDAIQKAAIAYYEKFDDPVSRAEEIYHRLLLGQTAQEVDPRWTVAGIEDLLRNALEEMEGAARSYLASRLRIELYDDDLDALEDTTWERVVIKRAEDLIRLDRPEHALAVMQRRSYRPDGTELYWLEARVLRQLGRVREARQVATEGIVKAGALSVLGSRPAAIRPSWIDLRILRAECDETLSDGVDWRWADMQFSEMVSAFSNEPRIVRFALAYLRLAARNKLTSPEINNLTRSAVGVLEHGGSSLVRTLVQELPSLSAFDRFRTEAPSAPTVAPARPEQSFKLKTDDTQELLVALQDALPSTSELAALLRGMGVDLANVTPTGPADVMLLNATQWARTNGRLDELVSAAATYNPKAVGLRRFLYRAASRMSYKAASPIEAVILPGGRPFFGRKILRQFVSQLLSNEPKSRVLFVEGPPGSGKSFTREYLNYVATETGRFSLSSCELGAFWSLQDVIGFVHSRLGWRLEENFGDQPKVRQTNLYADMLINKARRSKLTTLLLFDGEPDEMQTEVMSLLRALELRLDTAQVPVALVLTGFPFATGLQTASRETLGYLSPSELSESLQRLADDIKLPPSTIPDLTESILSAAGNHDTGYNRRVHSAASRMLANLVARAAPVRVYVSYSHRDEELCRRLQLHLAPLVRAGNITLFSDDGNLAAGEDWQARLLAAMDTSEIILALVSPDFMSSSFVWESEMKRALERHIAGEAALIPVLLRPCDWQHTPIGNLQGLPRNGKFVTTWADADEAFTNVAEEVGFAAARTRNARGEPVHEA